MKPVRRNDYTIQGEHLFVGVGENDDGITRISHPIPNATRKEALESFDQRVEEGKKVACIEGLSLTLFQGEKKIKSVNLRNESSIREERVVTTVGRGWIPATQMLNRSSRKKLPGNKTEHRSTQSCFIA